MLAIYQALARIAQEEFGALVARTILIGGTPASPNKLRVTLKDRSFVDIWLSEDGDYAYHKDQPRQVLKNPAGLLLHESIHATVQHIRVNQTIEMRILGKKFPARLFRARRDQRVW